MESWAHNLCRRIALCVGALAFAILSVRAEDLPPPSTEVDSSTRAVTQAADEVLAKSHGCLVCHENATDMHRQETVKLGCADCHGGNPNAITEAAAHVHPRFPDAWRTSANPVRSYTLLNHE